MLEGMRIVSFCHYLQGPAATQYLADMGAEVIKIEPIDGAYERRWSGGNVFVGDVSSFFLSANRNKRAVALDLKSPEGLAVALDLIDRADAVLENFRPGVLDRLGLGYEALKARKADIIFVSASGFGSSGPMRDQPGQDLMVQARSGLIAASSGGDTAVGAAVCDQHGGALLALGLVGAYVRKLKTGQGTLVEGSLYNAAVDLQTESIVNFISGNRDSASFDRDPHLATWFHQAPYGVYTTRDGRNVVVSLNNPAVFAEALDDEGLRALSGIDLLKERDRYARATAEAISKLDFEPFQQAMNKARMWWAPIHDYNDLVADPQAQHCQMFRTVELAGGSATLVNHPLRYDGAVPELRHLATEIGHDTRDVLAELGYASDRIDLLARTGVIRVRTKAAADEELCG